MTKAELESKHLAELHTLAAEKGIPRYRMLPRGELIAKLASGEGESRPQSRPRSQSSRPPRRSRSNASSRDRERGGQGARKPPSAPPRDPPPAPTPASSASESSPRKRRRRRRPFSRRRSRELRVHELLLPTLSGRQVIVHAETREGCTTLLREIATELSGDSKGPEPVILLVDPNPEELAAWRREVPQAEIVAAGQAKHADDALAQAGNRAGKGEDVILLIDSLSRLGEAYGDGASAKTFFDSGRDLGGSGSGSLTVVAAVERAS
jgi:hypothetical protein